MAKRIVICIMLGVGTVAVWIVHSYRLESLGFRRVTVTAVLSDGEGNPVRGVPVTLWTGKNSERRFHQIFRCVSNRAGRASARGWAQTGVGCSTAGNVYYPSRGERLIAFAETPREARHSVEIPIPMRRVRNPVRMLVGYFSTANTRPGVCFDLVKGDYLPPYGRGEAADMAAVWRQTGGDGAHSGDTTYDLLFTNGVDGVTPEQLRGTTVFHPNPECLFTNSIPFEARNAILAKGIPALSYPAGGFIMGLQLTNHEIDLNGGSFRINGWGRQNQDPFHLDWMHGDMKDMAYYYIHKLYDDFLEKGVGL